MEASLLEEYYQHIIKGIKFGKVKNIVFRILADLTDRRGLRQEWDAIGEDIQNEIIKEWISIVEKESK